MFENLAAGNPGQVQGSCPNRKESQPLNSRAASLFLMNYFPTNPVERDACKENSNGLVQMVDTCNKTAGNLMPNFVAVNYYMVQINRSLSVSLSLCHSGSLSLSLCLSVSVSLSPLSILKCW